MPNKKIVTKVMVHPTEIVERKFTKLKDFERELEE